MADTKNTPAETLETFCSGDPLEYALKGVSEIPGTAKTSNESLADPISEQYGTSVSADTAGVLEQLNNAIDAKKLVRAVKAAGLNEHSNYDSLLTEDDVQEGVEPDLGTVMNLIDNKMTESLCDRESDASKVTSKRQRDTVYIPDLIADAEGGTVYMAKTLSSPAKVRMAWDLNSNNQVVVVDDYEKWEKLLGWEKLKSFPHGKNKIREEYGDRLSDEVLEIVAGENSVSDAETKDDSDSSSRGRRTRTKPSEERLNLARGRRQRQRMKIKSKDIAEKFEEGDSLGYHNIDMLVLFPSTTDRNMTDHWWVPGSKGGGGSVAIANCNKGTFEYLNQYEEVWHIDDYIEQAGDYEFETNAGPVNMNAVSTEKLVMHVISSANRERLMKPNVFTNMPSALVDYCEKEVYNSPDFPHPEDMVYAPITQEDVFWMRPELRKQQNPDEGDAIIAYADNTPRDIGRASSISSDYKLYARARLPDWDFGEVLELQRFDKASHYLKLDDGGYEVLETLGMLHDAGRKPYSESPKARWD